MKRKPTYSVTFELHKLEAIVFMISYLAGYNLDEVEHDAIRILIADTNAEKNKWLTWSLNGIKHEVLLKFAHDIEANWYYIQVYCPLELKAHLEIMDTFQGLFKKLEIDGYWLFDVIGER